MDKINGLLQIGLSRREAEVYLALLQRKEFTAPELARISTVTRTKIYEILQNLIRKGACSESIKDGQKIYRAINPAIFTENIISYYEKEIEQKKQSAIDQKRMVAQTLEKELTSLHETNRDKVGPIDYIEVLNDIGEIRNKWIHLQQTTKFEMLAFNKAPYSLTHKENAPNQQKMFKKNITGKGIYEYIGVNSRNSLDEFLDMVEMYSSLGEETRIIEELPMKMIIMDEKITMLALKDPVSLTTSITTMIITHPSFALAQKEVFKNYWLKSVRLNDFKKNLNKIISQFQ